MLRPLPCSKIRPLTSTRCRTIVTRKPSVRTNRGSFLRKQKPKLYDFEVFPKTLTLHQSKKPCLKNTKEFDQVGRSNVNRWISQHKSKLCPHGYHTDCSETKHCATKQRQARKHSSVTPYKDLKDTFSRRPVVKKESVNPARSHPVRNSHFQSFPGGSFPNTKARPRHTSVLTKHPSLDFLRHRLDPSLDTELEEVTSWSSKCSETSSWSKCYCSYCLLLTQNRPPHCKLYVLPSLVRKQSSNISFSDYAVPSYQISNSDLSYRHFGGVHNKAASKRWKTDQKSARYGMTVTSRGPCRTIPDNSNTNVKPRRTKRTNKWNGDYPTHDESSSSSEDESTPDRKKVTESEETVTSENKHERSDKKARKEVDRKNDKHTGKDKHDRNDKNACKKLDRGSEDETKHKDEQKIERLLKLIEECKSNNQNINLNITAELPHRENSEKSIASNASTIQQE